LGHDLRDPQNALCVVWVWPVGGTPHLAASVPHCNDDASTFLLIDVPPLDGKLDLVLVMADEAGAGTLEPVARQLPDGTFDVANAMDTPLFRPTSGAAPQAIDFLDRWVGAADLDGDGIEDLVFSTAAGGVIAFGDPERR
jgi:hypothetical protein